MLEAARRAGLRILGFSEHSPRPPEYTYPEDYQDKLKRHLPDYIDEVRQLDSEERLAPPDRSLRVLLGIEADFFPAHEDFTRDLIRKYPFDYVIGGLHFQGEWGFDFRSEDWEGLDDAALSVIYGRYYADLAAMCRSGMFHVAAHPDLIKLFTKKRFDAWLETPEAESLVRSALLSIRDNGMLMEISSAGLRKPCDEIYPGPKIMALAAELDVPISFASDAHCINTPAFAFAALARYAHSFGYRKYHLFMDGSIQSLPFTPPSTL